MRKYIMNRPRSYETCESRFASWGGLLKGFGDAVSGHKGTTEFVVKESQLLLHNEIHRVAHGFAVSQRAQLIKLEGVRHQYA